jgi:hypothetical protein
MENMEQFSDWDNPAYYNIQQFRALDDAGRSLQFAKVAGAGR